MTALLTGGREVGQTQVALTCGHVSGRYWDRTSDLSGVNGALYR